MTSIFTSGYQKNSDGTVLDRVTNLIWLDEGRRRQEWKEALDYGNAASGWRLPNIKELTSIMDLGCPNAVINPAIFPGISGGFWSSSSVIGRTTWAWYADFDTGGLGGGLKTRVNFSPAWKLGVLLVKDGT